ncbi:MAG TPA: hypothetical protein VFZ61_33860, partial [Polyangiales bacterium]
MMRWNWKVALVCAALATSACESDATPVPEQADAAVEPSADAADTDAPTEDDALTAPDGSSGDAAFMPDAEQTTPQADAGGEDAATLDASSDPDAGMDATPDASDTGDANAQIDTGLPDVPPPPVCTDDCSGHGTCVAQSGANTCVCDVGYGGATCGVCSSGYTRSAGGAPCLPLSAVIEVRTLPPNGTCANGGHTLVEGVDSDLSGSLDPGEVTREQVVCKVVRAGNVVVTNAAELESLRGVTDITGSLTIKAPFVTTLEPLKQLINVGTSLLIEGSNALLDFEGLAWLDSVGGTFTIRNNASLISTKGMTALRLVSSSLVVENNGALEQLQLGPLQVVQVDVTVSGNPKLIALEGTRLRSVVGALRLLSNAKLEALSAFAGLKAIGGAVEIKQCDALTHLRGLGQLSDVGPLSIEDNDGLVDVSALAALRSVRGSLTLRSLQALQIGLGDTQLTAVNGSLVFNNLPLLPRLGTFSKLATLGGTLQVMKTGVEVVAPFPALTSFAAASGNDPLLAGCSPSSTPIDPTVPPAWPTGACMLFTDTLVLRENPLLRQFGGFPLRMTGAPQTIGSVVLYQNPLLAQVENLPFTSLQSTLRLENLPALRALPLLAALDKASSVLIQNTALDSIELTKLATSSVLRVNRNVNATLLALPLKPALTTLELTENAALTTLSIPTLTQVGTLNISDNRALVSFELPQLTKV